MNTFLNFFLACFILLSFACNTAEKPASSYPIAPRKIFVYYGHSYRYRSYSGVHYGTYRYGNNHRFHHGYGGGFHHRYR